MPGTSGDGGALRAYHERTKHSPARLRADPHVLDWRIMPRPFKVYADLDPIPLPRDLGASVQPALAAIAGQAPTNVAPPPLDLVGLARLLFLSAGVLRHRRHAGGEIFFRAAACTGALYHIDLYVVCEDLPGLAAGVYHFGPHDFALRRLRAGDNRRTVVSATAAQSAVAAAPVLLLYASTFWRNAWKYRERAYRHCFWDAGTILANLLALATAVALPATIVQGFVDAELNALLGLDTEREAVLGLVALGRGGSPPPAAPPPGPLGLAVLPVSDDEVDYPAIRAAHARSSLASPADVERWRSGTMPTPPEGQGTITLGPVALDAVAEPIETVILRRGSTRRFPARPIDRAQLDAIVHAATRPVPADVAPAPDLYLVVHAVRGVMAGTYAVARDGRTATLLRAGAFRREAGFLGLGQALPADAAVNLYWLIDLDEVFRRFGDRGYRAAQLAAAVAGGRTYLAAYAQRLGATGLTFFDDEVTAFFEPHAAGKSVLFLAAVGRRGRRAGG
jgi:SagB-type dehydrogenase family enzyme